MGTSVDSNGRSPTGERPALEIRLLGPYSVRRSGVTLALPASRKARALLAYLLIASRPATRSQLCDVFWNVPNDPRGELRWCLSKIRKLVDEPGRHRVEACGDTLRLDLIGCFVDAVEIDLATRQGLDTLATERLRALAVLFAGDFLDGLALDHNPGFEAWLLAQRRRFRDIHTAVLDELTRRVPDDEASVYVDCWLRLAPFDLRPHELLLRRLASRGRPHEAEEHLSATGRLFEAEGLDRRALSGLWQAVQSRTSEAIRVQTVVSTAAAAASTGEAVEGRPIRLRRASVAVMPFADASEKALPGGPADALAHDIITRLARLRSLFVIAQGTVFALKERGVAPEEAGRMLGVDYVVVGSVRRHGNRLRVDVELAEARGSRLVWAEVFSYGIDDTFLVLDEIGNQIVAAVDQEIETLERNRAVLKPPNTLDAWEAHHRGLWHMYRFTKSDNDLARHFFELSLRSDPTFARAHAALSFTHWQNAFQGWAERDNEIEAAFAAAGQSLMADDRDPAAHWAMGRALWLRGRHDQSVDELEEAVELSPNFALGHYSLAFVHSQTGDPYAALASSDLARSLSPYDPLLFGMLASRALALVRLRRFEEAAEWAVKAAARPNAHAHILAISALSLALAGMIEEARVHRAVIKAKLPLYGLNDFLAAFHLSPDDASLFRSGAKRIGLD